MNRWLKSILGMTSMPAVATRFLSEAALVDPAAALDLAGRELAALAERLPAYLDQVREETRARASTPAAALHGGTVSVLEQVDRHLAALAERVSPQQRQLADALSERSQLLRSLSDAVRELTEVIGRAGQSGDIKALTADMAEALHVILLSAVDAIREPDAVSLNALRQLTGDRGALMDGIRQGLVRGGRTLTVDEHHILFTSTALFERTIRLLRRFQDGLLRGRT